MKLQPLGSSLVVQIIPKTTKKASSIHLPESVDASLREEEQEVVVLSIGPSAWKGEPPVKVGDRVIITKFAGFSIASCYGKNLKIINDGEVLVKLDEGE